MCRSQAVVCLLLIAGASAAIDAADKQRPVAKVLSLLNDMKAQLEKEAAKDEELYENFQCWCTTYDTEKTKAVEIATQHIDELTTAIEENTAKQAQLETDIERLGKEVASNMKAMEEATAIRSKETAEFSTTESDLKATVGSLGGAVKALGAAHGAGFTQESMLQVQRLLKSHMSRFGSKFAKKFTAWQESAVMSFVQQPVAAKSYAAQSGAIFGILKQMKDTFESNLEDATTNEKRARSQFGEMKSAKGKELAAAKDQTSSKNAELADTKMKLAVDKEDLEDTRAALESDSAFLSDLKSKCASMDKTWEARSKMRNDEATAIAETIKILDADEAHDTFSKSLGLVQVRSAGASGIRSRVTTYLRKEGVKLHSNSMVKLANETATEDDAFGAVKDNIDGLIANLHTTQEEEVKERDFCVKELNANEDQTTAANNKKEDLTQKIEDLTAVKAAATDAIEQANQEIHETHVAMKQAGGNRASENKEFQAVVGDARATQQILAKALLRLEAFYGKSAALLQRGRQERQVPGAAAPEAPAGFGAYEKQGGADGALGLLKMIIKESEATERQATEAENEAQADYESFMKESSASIAALTAEVTDKSEQLAKADGEIELAKTDLSSTQQDLYNLDDFNRQLHRRCDYLLDNYEVRQSSRAEEIESLEQAKAMFSGANFGL